ncbi:Reverse transcriptase/retrotransposon-derived protein [Theobroma cacao]|nr:Reverse transcriptase/retrotransposon-derived protein [Theobroma cacao]
MDYRKLNKAMRKYHFPLPFIDQMLDRLASSEYYCFLDGYLRYNKITIAPKDQEKITFTCLYEKIIEVFMDDFSVFGNNFDKCLFNLNKVLQRCEETNLVLNWKECYFMVQEGIVLGYKVSSKGLEVDKAKIDTIEMFPPLSLVKRIRSFLRHTGFIGDSLWIFPKLLKPFRKDIPFKFDDACHAAFIELKKKLTIVPIIVVSNWSLPFELMCNASDHVVGAMLRQRKNKMFHLIYYASKTLTETQMHYTTTEKELLVVKCAGRIIRRCIPNEEVENMLRHCHSSEYGGHFRRDRTTAKVLQSGLYWPTLFKDAHNFVCIMTSVKEWGHFQQTRDAV